MGERISLRTFAERVDEQLSEEVKVTSGVPQGSVIYCSSLMLMILGETMILIYGCSQMIV
jgi:hypothetical protein